MSEQAESMETPKGGDEPTGKLEVKESYSYEEVLQYGDRRGDLASVTARQKADKDHDLKMQEAIDKQGEETKKQTLIENHKHKELSEMWEEKYLSLEQKNEKSEKSALITKMLSEKNIGEYADLFLNISSPIEEIEVQMNNFVLLQEQKIGDGVKEQLTVSPPLKGTSDLTIADPLSWSSEQLAEHKKTLGIKTYIGD